VRHGWRRAFGLTIDHIFNNEGHEGHEGHDERAVALAGPAPGAVRETRPGRTRHRCGVGGVCSRALPHARCRGQPVERPLGALAVSGARAPIVSSAFDNAVARWVLLRDRRVLRGSVIGCQRQNVTNHEAFGRANRCRALRGHTWRLHWNTSLPRYPPRSPRLKPPVNVAPVKSDGYAPHFRVCEFCGASYTTLPPTIVMTGRISLI